MPAPDTESTAARLPRVTIVTPAYNQARYLPETIESVLAQDYPNIEYIVIDDGSTDNTLEVLQRYEGRIRWESQENQGQAATLNRGWQSASGEIIGYLSSDDLLKPNAVRTLVGYLLDHPEVVLVYPDFELIDAEGKHIRDFRTPDYSEFDLRVNLICQPGPGALFRKACFDRIGGWNTELRQIPDFEYWLRLSLEGDFRRIPAILSASRVHEDSQSFNILSVERAMEPVRVIEQYCESRKGLMEASWESRSRAKAHLLAARMLLRSGWYRLGARELLTSLRLFPPVSCSAQFWRILVTSISGKWLHRILFKMSR